MMVVHSDGGYRKLDAGWWLRDLATRTDHGPFDTEQEAKTLKPILEAQRRIIIDEASKMSKALAQWIDNNPGKVPSLRAVSYVVDARREMKALQCPRCGRTAEYHFHTRSECASGCGAYVTVEPDEITWDTVR